MKKISVIGNSCSGKTTLSRIIHKKSQLPLIHVDSIQFLPHMQWRDPNETREILSNVAQQPEWIIDGFGPLKIIEDRFAKADLIIFIRIPLWQTYWWCLKRQIKALFVRRTELPEDCFEATPSQTLKLIKTIWNVHHGLWVQLDRIFQAQHYADKVVYVRNVAEFDLIVNMITS